MLAPPLRTGFDAFGFYDRSLVRLFAYLKETRDFVLLIRQGADGESGQWALYTDSDFAGDRASRRSTTGFCFGILWESGVFSPVEWCSQVQKAVSLSTADRENRAQNGGGDD